MIFFTMQGKAVAVFWLLLLLFTFPGQAQSGHDWENPNIFQKNKLDPHTPVFPFASKANALADSQSASEYYRSLNGSWKFKWVKKPAEFDVTPYLQKGENTIALQIYRWSDGAYLEGQDYWKISGLERDVYLYTRPVLHVKDLQVQSPLINNYTDGKLDITTWLQNSSGKERSGKLNIQLLSGNQEVVFEEDQSFTLKGQGSDSIAAKTTISAPEPWTAETPNLYRLLLTVKDENGSVTQVVRSAVGFRTVEVNDGQLQVNGSPIYLRGVNRHEHNPVTGNYLSQEEMLEDIRLMKQFNINAVRASHYPNDPLWYKLTDKYGLYVIDEANVEAHGMQSHPEGFAPVADNPEWKAAIMDRTRRMVERDKNHPSIIIWSQGNESGFGSNFKTTYQWIKQRDPSRPVQYEPAWRTEYTDIAAPMYHQIEEMLEYVAGGERDKPMILCEYAHAMGNSVGNLQDYWHVMEHHKNFQGGFIWDWVDQTLLEKNAAGEPFWAYGGDYPEPTPNDSNFVANGLVQADRSLKPHIWEVKKVYQPINMEAIDLPSGTIGITNLFGFTNLKNYEFSWKIEENGQTVQSGTLPSLDIPGGVGEQYHAYVRPQETGNKTGVRWFSLRDKTNTGLKVAGNPTGTGDNSTINASFYPFPHEDAGIYQRRFKPSRYRCTTYRHNYRKYR